MRLKSQVKKRAEYNINQWITRGHVINAAEIVGKMLILIYLICHEVNSDFILPSWGYSGWCSVRISHYRWDRLYIAWPVACLVSNPIYTGYLNLHLGRLRSWSWEGNQIGGLGTTCPIRALALCFGHILRNHLLGLSRQAPEEISLVLEKIFLASGATSVVPTMRIDPRRGQVLS